MSYKSIVRTTLLALVVATATLSGTANAGDCHRPQPRCYWKTVIKYDYVQKPYYVTRTRYDHCGKPYHVRIKKWRTVKVPYKTRIKVCY